jgi:hypothetical protein
VANGNGNYGNPNYDYKDAKGNIIVRGNSIEEW